MITLNDRVVVAVSGGPDSIALLHFLHSIRDEYNLYIHGAHLNHMLRGQESEGDTLYVRDFCKKFNIPLSVRYVDVGELAKRKGISLEEAGRMARYELFRDTAAQVGATKIALAHNMNDQAETILMRIMRGTGLEGLCGIKPVREGLYIRPLLFTSRREIEDYCNLMGLKPRIDSTNLEPLYARNKVRLELIPYIEQNFNSAIERTLSSMAELLSEDRDFLNQYAENAYKGIVLEKQHGVSLDIKGINELHTAVKKRVIRKAIEYVKGNLVGIESRHLDLILSAVNQGNTGASVELPGGIKAAVQYNQLNIMKLKGETKDIFCHNLIVPGITEIKEIGGLIEAEIIEGNLPDYSAADKFTRYFDYDRIKENLIARSRRDGDFMVPLGMKGKKKIKDIFIDSKVPREERDSIPLVSCDGEVIWIVGYRISDNYKITQNTKKVLKLQYKDNKDNKGEQRC